MDVTKRRIHLEEYETALLKTGTGAIADDTLLL
jgi:hypothetical protein